MGDARPETGPCTALLVASDGCATPVDVHRPVPRWVLRPSDGEQSVGDCGTRLFERLGAATRQRLVYQEAEPAAGRALLDALGLSSRPRCTTCGDPSPGWLVLLAEDDLIAVTVFRSLCLSCYGDAAAARQSRHRPTAGRRRPT